MPDSFSINDDDVLLRHTPARLNSPALLLKGRPPSLDKDVSQKPRHAKALVDF